MKQFAPPDDTITSSLSRIVLFEDLSPEQLTALARIVRRPRFPKDSLIGPPVAGAGGHGGGWGSPTLRGSGDTPAGAPDGRQFLLAELGPLDYFGEMALL